MRWLEKQGYICTRAAGSLGLWDVVAIGPGSVQLVQVKTNRWPGRAEMQALREFKLPWAAVRKVLHRWRDGRREPDVKVLS